MRINTNMAAMNAWKAMSSNQANLQNSLERLSSGFRINKAADDAAGLAVSEKLQSQTRGMAMATRNTQDAVSMVQTAEGGASKIQDMLQRMRELAVQSGSDTLQDTDRAQLQEEFSSLQAEIDRTAGSVQFNGRKLINGASGGSATLNVGATVTNLQIGTLDAAMTSRTLTVATVAKDAQVWSSGAIAAGAKLSATFAGIADDHLVLDRGATNIDIDMTATYNPGSGAVALSELTATEFVGYINATFGAQLTAAHNGTGITITSDTSGTAGAFAYTGDAVTAMSMSQSTAASDTLQVTDSVDGVLVIADNFTVDGSNITGKADYAGISFTASTGNSGTITLTANSLSFQVGANNGETITTSLGDMTAKNMLVDSVSIDTKGHATTAIDALDKAVSFVSGHRAKMGALQNRLENTISTLQTQSENITAADSRIRDVDMASEMATFTRFQVLSQASTAMLAQANALPQGILSLLR